VGGWLLNGSNSTAAIASPSSGQRRIIAESSMS
jgi:hypothetical protein